MGKAKKKVLPEGQLKAKWVNKVRVAPRNPSSAWEKDSIRINKVDPLTRRAKVNE